MLLAVAFLFVGVTAWEVLGWGAAVFLCAVPSFLLLAAAYAGLGAPVLGKRPDGRLHPLGRVLLAPYHGLGALGWWLFRLTSQEPPFAEAAPNLFFGRRLTGQEARQPSWVGVLDLAGEFAAGRALREIPQYRSLPVLDATAPTEDELREAVAWLADAVRRGPVYVH